MNKYLIVFGVLLLAACNSNVKRPDDNLMMTPGEANKVIWVYDYEKGIPVRNRPVNPDTLTPQKLLNIINTDKIHADFVKISGDTIFVAIKESTYLTQQIGTAGAYDFMSTATYTLTELKGIRYVNYAFVEGDHAQPGTHSRKDFLR